MHKKFVYSYLVIVIILLMSLSLSRSTSEKLRVSSVSLFSPLWEYFLKIRHFLSNPSEPFLDKGDLSGQEEIQHLQLENQLLQIEIADFHHLLHYQKKIQNKLDQLTEIAPQEALHLKQQNQKTLNRVISNVQWQVRAMPARVIFRSFDQWNSVVWINIGEADNENETLPIVAKNSPVLIDQAIVGVIDYVGMHQSRVRLISDARITPSVRSARGGEYDLLMSDYVDNVLHAITPKMAASLTLDEYHQLKQLLSKLKQSLHPFKKSFYLAKGELRGSLHPLGYGPPILKGVGFNYDFSDDEGESRDLRTGSLNVPSKFSKHHEEMPILKVNDVLVTTGMDGIFPPGLKVAAVTKIGSLKEGDYYYELEAKPIANNLEELSLVFVIPPFRAGEEFML
ncbi:MAG: rod shape-determining protein MreC [Chlamydiales bacterium]